MSHIKDKDVRVYIASAIFVLLIILLMLFLTFIKIPGENKDLVVAIISMLVGGLGMAMGKLFGDFDTEREKLEKQYEELAIKYEVLKSHYDELLDKLVKRIEIAPSYYHYVPEKRELPK